MFLRILFILSLLSFSSVNVADVQVKDDTGHQVILPQTSSRIISLAPHLTELLFAIGAGEQLVGVVDYSDYPPAAKKIPNVGGYNDVDLERILLLKPDLVVAWQSGNNSVQLNKLKSFAIPVFINEPRHLQDIIHTAKRLSVLTGHKETGQLFTQAFEQHYQHLKSTYSQRSKVKLFYQIWYQPIMTINGEHLISDVIRLCGAENVFAELAILAPTINVEAVLLAKPEIIVTGGMGEKRPEWLDGWSRWPQVPAVKNKQLYYIDPDLMQRHGPRILDGAELLCQQIEQARQASSK